LKLQIGKCKLKILFFQFSFCNYFTRFLTRGASASMTTPVIFEIANWKVQIENFIFPIFILQLFHTFFGR